MRARIGKAATQVAAVHRFADIDGVASYLADGLLGGSQREFAPPERPAATAAHRPAKVLGTCVHKDQRPLAARQPLTRLGHEVRTEGAQTACAGHDPRFPPMVRAFLDR